MQLVGRVLRRVRRALVPPGLPPLDQELAYREAVFRMPPFTREIAAAARLIAPQFPLKADERSRAFFETDQNAACWGELEAVAPYLEKRPVPRRVLEIGPGMGRSLVFFPRKLGWEGAELHAYEGAGDRTRYTLMGPRFDDSFCGSPDVLRQVLSFNGVEDVQIHDAQEHGGRLRGLPGPFDLVYAFYSIGFHWGLEHFLDEILDLLARDGLALFTVPAGFVPFPELEAVEYRLVKLCAAWPVGTRHQMLLLSKSELPDLG